MSKDDKAFYYDAGGIEVLDIIKAKLTREQYKGYLLGNVIKYAARANWKNDFDRDAEKMRLYAKWLFDFLPPVKRGKNNERENDSDGIGKAEIHGSGV